MEQFFLRAVKAQLPVKANTDLSHRPALVAESLSTMAFLSLTLDTSLCRRNEERVRHFKRYNQHRWGRPQRCHHLNKYVVRTARTGLKGNFSQTLIFLLSAGSLYPSGRVLEKQCLVELEGNWYLKLHPNQENYSQIRHPKAKQRVTLQVGQTFFFFF